MCLGLIVSHITKNDISKMPFYNSIRFVIHINALIDPIVGSKDLYKV